MTAVHGAPNPAAALEGADEPARTVIGRPAARAEHGAQLLAGC